MRNSKAYAGFKVFNGGIFIVLGAAIVARMLMTVGLRFEAVPGLVLGAAMFGLGLHRVTLFVRSRR